MKNTLFKIGLFYTAFALIAYCCSTTKSTGASKQCKEGIKAFISDLWFYNPETNTYSEIRETIIFTSPQFTLNPCIQSMNKEDLIEVFGEPSREDTVKNRLFYLYLSTDFQYYDSTKYCNYCMYIQLDSLGHVAKFVFPVM